MGRNRTAWKLGLAAPAAMGLALMAPAPANALISIFGAPSAAVSLTALQLGGIGVGVAGAAAVAEVAKDGAGKYVAAGAVLLLVADPIDATYYNGAFGINFAPDLLDPFYSGWLGGWGDTPSDPAPPVDGSGTFAVGTMFTIHAANPGLTTSVTNDLTAGVQTVTFDWGPLGHAESGAGHFNFYATAFRAKHNLFITNLGAGAGPMAGANLFTSNLGITCSAAGSDVITTDCGSPTSHSFSTTLAVPEPGTWLMFLAGFGMLGSVIRRRRLEA